MRLAALAVLFAIAGLMSVWASSVNAQPAPCDEPGGVQPDCVNGMSVETAAPAMVGANVAVMAAGAMRQTKMGTATGDGSLTTWVAWVAQVRYQCIGAGTATLRLVPPVGG